MHRLAVCYNAVGGSNLVAIGVAIAPGVHAAPVLIPAVSVPGSFQLNVCYRSSVSTWAVLDPPPDMIKAAAWGRCSLGVSLLGTGPKPQPSRQCQPTQLQVAVVSLYVRLSFTFQGPVLRSHNAAAQKQRIAPAAPFASVLRN